MYGDWYVRKNPTDSFFRWNYAFITVNGDWSRWGPTITRRGAIRKAKHEARKVVAYRTDPTVEIEGNVTDNQHRDWLPRFHRQGNVTDK